MMKIFLPVIRLVYMLLRRPLAPMGNWMADRVVRVSRHATALGRPVMAPVGKDSVPRCSRHSATSAEPLVPGVAHQECVSELSIGEMVRFARIPFPVIVLGPQALNSM